MAKARTTAAVLALLVTPASAQQSRYLQYPEARETLELFAGSGIDGSRIRDAAAWDGWIRAQDRSIRARVERGVEDSLSNLILYGTSFTSLPRLDSATTAVNATGDLTPAAQARVKALEAALRASPSNERLRFVHQFLARRGIGASAEDEFFTANLRRMAGEQESYQKALSQAAGTADVNAVRGDLYRTRGLSVDTSLLPNFALEQTLAAMLRKGAAQKAAVRRIAIVGPGLDFADKRDGYDYYPLQTIQPFAVMEAVERLGLSGAAGLSLDCLDLNEAVLRHVESLAGAARAGRGYSLQLPLAQTVEWSPAAVAYWEHFGDRIGSAEKPLAAPPALGGVKTRAVRVRAEAAARLNGRDLDIVAQTLDREPPERYDLVVATNILVYYDPLQQALAMANIARMMNTGGFFLSNTILPAQHTPDLVYLGRRPTAYTSNGEYGDDIVVYRRR